MIQRKKITLRSIKNLWDRTGQRPVEVPLITPELVDRITSLSRQSDEPLSPMMLAPSFCRHAVSPHGRKAWIAAASLALLIAAGTVWLIRATGDEAEGREMARVVCLEEHPSAEAVVADCPAHETMDVSKGKAEYTMVEHPTQWQTSQEITSAPEDFSNGGMVCYSDGRRTDNCDEEMVMRMLLAFL